MLSFPEPKLHDDESADGKANGEPGEAELCLRQGKWNYETALFTTPWPHTTPPSLNDVICSAGALPLLSVLILKPEFRSRKSFLPLPPLTLPSLAKPVARGEGPA